MTVLHPKHEAEVADTLKHFEGWSERLATQFAADMAGYAIVVWDRTGLSRTEIMVSGISPFGPRMLPAFVAECTRSDLTERVVRDVLKGT